MPTASHRRLLPALNKLRLRPPVAKGSASPADPWWESKILLLVLGAILTNFLAPHIQDNLEVIKWRRQQQVQQARQSIEAMNHFMRDFADLQALSSRIDTASRIALSPRPTKVRRALYERTFDTSMNEWYSQTAKVAGELTLFQESGSIRESFQRYCSLATEAHLLYRDAVLKGKAAVLATQRDAYADRINNGYETVLNASRKEVFREQTSLADELKRSASPWALY